LTGRQVPVPGREVSIMELKIKVNAITIKDENTGEEYTIKTVWTARHIYEYLGETEGEALGDKVYDLGPEYR
jgi:hypothetical protein